MQTNTIYIKELNLNDAREQCAAFCKLGYKARVMEMPGRDELYEVSVEKKTTAGSKEHRWS